MGLCAVSCSGDFVRAGLLNQLATRCNIIDAHDDVPHDVVWVLCDLPESREIRSGDPIPVVDIMYNGSAIKTAALEVIERQASSVIFPREKAVV